MFGTQQLLRELHMDSETAASQSFSCRPKLFLQSDSLGVPLLAQGTRTDSNVAT